MQATVEVQTTTHVDLTGEEVPEGQRGPRTVPYPFVAKHVAMGILPFVNLLVPLVQELQSKLEDFETQLATIAGPEGVELMKTVSRRVTMRFQHRITSAVAER